MLSRIYKQIILIGIFMLLTPITIAISLFSLATFSINSYTHIDEDDFNKQNMGVHIYAALPENLPSVDVEIVAEDARVEIIRQYLEKYNSPLLGREETIVEAADRYGLDFRLTTAIAQQESNLCKRIPPGTHNCWGWGIHSRGTLGFLSYEEGIFTVSKGLKDKYINEGFTTPEIIMTKYTPLSNGSWAEGVSQFMSEML